MPVNPPVELAGRPVPELELLYGSEHNPCDRQLAVVRHGIAAARGDLPI